MLSEKNLFLLHMGQTSPKPLMIEIERAEGIWLYGPDGKKYIDLVSGVSVSNVGHSNPAVVTAGKEQLDKYMHLMVYGEIVQSPQVKYAKRLSDLLPPPLKSVYFVNSGSEAIEGAMKLAKRYTGRSKFVSFNKAYHGSTHGALSIQGTEFYRNAYRPLLPDTWQIEFNDIEALDIIDNKTAAVIVEPVQAEAGIIQPENEYLLNIRDRCDRTGTLLIFDEIQTGFGRTGTLFAMEHFNVVPDILCLAKAMGGGLPLGAFISSGDIMMTLSNSPALGHITTFGGHPVSCATGLAAFEEIIKGDLAVKANEKGRRFMTKLKHESILSIRGSGLFLAVKLASPGLLNKFIESGPGEGLILDKFLFCDDAFRIAPPLTIINEEIDNACDRIHNVLDKITC